MHAHERHFPMTAIYEKHPSPPAFSRLQAIKTAEIYILGWFCGWWSLAQLVALMGMHTLTWNRQW
jgi:hypothetical protein